MAPESSVFGIVDDCRGNARWNGDSAGGDDLATSSNVIDVCTGGPGAFFTIALGDPASELRFERPTMIRDTLAIGRLRSKLRGIFAPSTSSRTGVRETAASDVLEALLAAVRLDVRRRVPSQSQNRRLKAVRLCQDYMVEHLERTVTLLDLAAVSGLGVRSLFNAFEAVTGLSPMAYLRTQRLNRVRSTLVEANPKETRIIDVAADWGFWHMGHFATAYAAMFGETPSQTLTKAKV